MSFLRRKVRLGRVATDQMDQTVVVVVESRGPHRLYKKSIRRKARLVAHDSQNQCRVGDLVRVIETRPLSKTKRWKVTAILDRQEMAEIQPDEIILSDPGVPEAESTSGLAADGEEGVKQGTG